MTSANAPRRFTRLEVQTILAEVGVADWQTYMILQRMGALGDPAGTLGASVHRALGLLHAQNRPLFASPNTYGGMAWDRAFSELGAAVLTQHDLAGVWTRLDEALALAMTLQGNEGRGYQHFIWLSQALVELEYGARPAPPAALPAPAPTVDQGAVLLAPSVAFAQVNEQDFPRLFQETLGTLHRTWMMLPAGARRFAATQLGAWLRSIGVGDAAAEQVETFDP